jgi:hypothetical protein
MQQYNGAAGVGNTVGIISLPVMIGTQVLKDEVTFVVNEPAMCPIILGMPFITKYITYQKIFTSLEFKSISESRGYILLDKTKLIPEKLDVAVINTKLHLPDNLIPLTRLPPYRVLEPLNDIKRYKMQLEDSYTHLKESKGYNEVTILEIEEILRKEKLRSQELIVPEVSIEEDPFFTRCVNKTKQLFTSVVTKLKYGLNTIIFKNNDKIAVKPEEDYLLIDNRDSNLTLFNLPVRC